MVPGPLPKLVASLGAFLFTLYPSHGAAQAGTDPSPDPRYENQCHDPAIWDRIEALRRQVPDDDLVLRAYALRIGLCRLIDEGRISLEKGIELFEIERRRTLMERAQEDARKKQPPPIPLEDLEPHA